MTDTTPSLRINRDNPNHHLWNNNGSWWCHYTLHHADYTKQRIRRSLGTANLGLARQRRDRLLATLQANAPEDPHAPALSSDLRCVSV